MVDKRQQDMGMTGDADMPGTTSSQDDEVLQRKQTDQQADTGEIDLTGE